MFFQLTNMLLFLWYERLFILEHCIGRSLKYNGELWLKFPFSAEKVVRSCSLISEIMSSLSRSLYNRPCPMGIVNVVTADRKRKATVSTKKRQILSVQSQNYSINFTSSRKHSLYLPAQKSSFCSKK